MLELAADKKKLESISMTQEFLAWLVDLEDNTKVEVHKIEEGIILRPTNGDNSTKGESVFFISFKQEVKDETKQEL